MKPTQIILIIGRLDCLPKANNIPIGKDATMPEIPTISDKVKPPILRDSTNGKLTGISDANNSAKGEAITRKNINVLTKTCFAF